MQEISTEIKTYIVRAHCECGGEFIPESGVMYTGEPVSYQHQCNKCDAAENFDYSYPRTIFKEV